MLPALRPLVHLSATVIRHSSFGIRHSAFLLASLALSTPSAFAATPTPNVDPVGMREETDAIKRNDARMAWWRDARFGLFIHWGIYSVPARRSEWIMALEKIPVADYRAFAKDFNPVSYDPAAWARLAKEAGMRYIVITAKHHEGFALWPSAASDWDIADATPYKKDLLGPLASAARSQGLKFGLYYSQGQDWINKGGGRYGPTWDPAQEGNFDDYLDRVALPQVSELLANYKPDIIWWDTPAYMNPQRAKRFTDLLAPHPRIITNNRLGGRVPGDLKTPEQYVPASGYSGDWETCMTIGHSWGYIKTEKPAKPVKELVEKLAEIVSKGGNFLLNISPLPDGTLPPDQVDRLRGIGRWMQTNSESIYGASRSPFPRLTWGYATQNKNTVYLHVLKWPADGKLLVPLRNKSANARLLASPSSSLPIAYETDRLVITVPPTAPDPYNSVIALRLNSAPETLPAPTLGATIVASASRPESPASLVLDGGRDTAWVSPQGTLKATLEITLREPTLLNGFAFDEPETGSRPRQTYTVETLVGEEWKPLASDKTYDGRGAQRNFPAQTLQKFRITLEHEKESPLLAEFQLFRPE